jgi:hypothetical protein
MLDTRGNSFDSRHDQDIFLSSKTLRPPVGPTQSPVRRLGTNVSTEIKRPWREAYHCPPTSAEVKNECRYTSAVPIRLHDVHSVRDRRLLPRFK